MTEKIIRLISENIHDRSGLEIDRGGGKTPKSFTWDESKQEWSLGQSTLAVTNIKAPGVNVPLYINDLQWPIEDGKAGQILSTNSKGALVWTDPVGFNDILGAIAKLGRKPIIHEKRTTVVYEGVTPPHSIVQLLFGVDATGEQHIDKNGHKIFGEVLSYDQDFVVFGEVVSDNETSETHNYVFTEVLSDDESSQNQNINNIFGEV